MSQVFVYGHKNPDTDSICSAISFAYLQNKLDASNVYVPRAASDINDETTYVLKTFGVEKPQVISDIRPQIVDANIEEVINVTEDMSIFEVWQIMNDKKMRTLPVVNKNGTPVGIITIGEVAKTCMNAKDDEVLGLARTPYQNILKVLEGDIVVKSAPAVVGGYVKTVSADNDTIRERIAEDDVAILINIDEKCDALFERKVQCIIVTAGQNVSQDIIEKAQRLGVTIISTKYDTYTTVNLINQSAPISYFMTPMERVCKFGEDAFIDDVKKDIENKRYRSFPVISNDEIKGVFAKDMLADVSQKKVMLVDHNELSQAVFGMDEADILEIVDHHKLGTIPTLKPIKLINMPVGCTATIIYQMYKEANIDIPKDIAGLLVSAIVSDTMLFKSPTCTDVDILAGGELAKIAGVELQEHWDNMLRASLNYDTKTDKEILYQDYKQFTAEGTTFGAGQVLVANAEDVEGLKNRMKPYLAEALKSEGIDFVCLMITNVSEDSTTLIYDGVNATSIIASAFNVKEDDGAVYLPGVVSRKKQLVPPVMEIL